MNDFKNILIVRTDRIGDVVLTTPAIKVLRQAYPAARISILVAPLTKDLVTGNLYLDEIIVDDRRGVHRGIFGFWHLASVLRQKKFDLAIVYHTKKRTNFLCWAAGIPRRTGCKNEKFGFLLNDPIRDERHFGKQHEAQYCLDVLKHLGISGNSIFDKSPQDLADDLYIPVSADSWAWIEGLCREQHLSGKERLIAIHPGASDPAKCWSEGQFAELIDQLVNRYQARIVLIGAPQIAGVARRIISGIHVPVLDLTGKTTVGQMAGLLKRCNLLVSNDSGPVHIAVGVKTPCVSIFTRNQPGINPQRWQPFGKLSRVVVSAPPVKSPVQGGTQCPETIPTRAVLEAVDALFKLC